MSESIGTKLRKAEEDKKKLALYVRQLEAENEKIKEAVKKHNEEIEAYLKDRDKEIQEIQIFTLDWAADIATLALHRTFGAAEVRTKRFDDAYDEIALSVADFIVCDSKEDEEAVYSLSKIDDELKEARGKYFVDRDRRKPERRLKPIDLS